jgi:hypothetical protein
MLVWCLAEVVYPGCAVGCMLCQVYYVMLVWCLVEVMYPGSAVECMLCQDRAIAPPVSNRGAPGSIPDEITWDVWWTTWHCDQFSPIISVFPANFHSTKCSTLIYHPGLVQLAN